MTNKAQTGYTDLLRALRGVERADARLSVAALDEIVDVFGVLGGAREEEVEGKRVSAARVRDPPYKPSHTKTPEGGKLPFSSSGCVCPSLMIFMSP